MMEQTAEDLLRKLIVTVEARYFNGNWYCPSCGMRENSKAARFDNVLNAKTALRKMLAHRAGCAWYEANKWVRETERTK